MPIKLNNLTQTFAKVGQEQNKNRAGAKASEALGVPAERPQSATELALARGGVEAGNHNDARVASRFSEAASASSSAQEVASLIKDDAGTAVQASASKLSKTLAALLT